MTAKCCDNPNVWVGQDYKCNDFRYRYFCKNCQKVWFKDGLLLQANKEKEILKKHLTDESDPD